MYYLVAMSSDFKRLCSLPYRRNPTKQDVCNFTKDIRYMTKHLPIFTIEALPNANSNTLCKYYMEMQDLNKTHHSFLTQENREKMERAEKERLTMEEQIERGVLENKERWEREALENKKKWKQESLESQERQRRARQQALYNKEMCKREESLKRITRKADRDKRKCLRDSKIVELCNLIYFAWSQNAQLTAAELAGRLGVDYQTLLIAIKSNDILNTLFKANKTFRKYLNCYKRQFKPKQTKEDNPIKINRRIVKKKKKAKPVRLLLSDALKTKDIAEQSYYTRSEVETIADMSKTAILRVLLSGQLIGQKLYGKQWFVEHKDLERYMAERLEKAR